MDSQQASGNVSTIVSIETTDGISVISTQNYFQRLSEDRSYMTFNGSDISNEVLSEGATIEFNTSVSHICFGQNRSNSNAYNVEVFAYYDSTHLEFVSLNVANKEYWSIGPSRNVTQPGLVYLENDLFSFHNKQTVSVTLKMKKLNGVMKGSKGEGAIVIDFAYKSNLQKFHGTPTKSTVKIHRYKFKVNDSNKENEVMLGYRIPKFTMVYDGVNGFFFFCFQRKHFMTRNYPNCYWQRHDSFAWNRVNDIVAILGIDVSSKVLYGIHHSGSVYLRAAFPFHEFYQIENSIWESAKDKSAMRKSIAVNDLSSMPTAITKELTISYAAVDVWAATRWNIMRKYGTLWRKVVQF